MSKNVYRLINFKKIFVIYIKFARGENELKTTLTDVPQMSPKTLLLFR